MGKPIVAAYLALMSWVLLRGSLGLLDSPVDLRSLLYLVVSVNLLPVLFADALPWDDRAVQDFAKGFVAATAVLMVVVWQRALGAGLRWDSWMTDFWLTQWSTERSSTLVVLTGITNYHWYSWNMGLAVLCVLFVFGKSETRYSWLRLVVTGLFLVACIQQIGLAGSRQSVMSLVFAVVVASWTRVRKTLLHVTAFVIVALLAFATLRVLSDLEPLPVTLMRGADTVAEAFDPAVSRGFEWQEGLQEFVRSPVIGVGFASAEGFSLGHNLVINTLANLGVIGMAALTLLVFLYVGGPLRTALRQRGPEVEINRGLASLQLFLAGTSLASGSVIASSGLFWIGAILIRRALPVGRRKQGAVPRQAAALSA
jgi:O-antigen ligase